MRECTASAYLVNLHQNQKIVVLQVDGMGTPNAIGNLLDYTIPSQRGMLPYRCPDRELELTGHISFPASKTVVP